MFCRGTFRVAFVAVLIVEVLILAAPAWAVHNDDFADATVLPGIPFRDEHSTVGATLERDEPLHAAACAGRSATVWYRWTPSEDAHVKVDTFGTEFDAYLSLWDGSSLSKLKLLDCDSGGTHRPARMIFDAQRGRTYHIRVSGEGNLVLVIDRTTLPCEDVLFGVSDTCYLSPAAP